MLPTCLSCQVKSNGMIAIHQHPNGLDEMFHSITGIEVAVDDHLCVPCYDALKSAHQFKQRCIQNNVVRLSGQASKTVAQVQPTTDQQDAASSSADVSTTCDDMRLAQELEGTEIEADGGKSFEIEVNLQQTHPEDADTQEDSQREETTQYIIDLELPREEHIEEAEEREDAFPLVSLESEEDDNEDSSTAIVPDEDRKHTSSSQSEQQNEEIKTKTVTPRLPRVHSLMCEFCFKEFKTLPEKIDHTETHQSEPKPFICFHAGCNGTFKDRVGLRAHVRIHETVKRFGCRYCSMRFHTRGNRNAHERTHNGEKPFVCPHCGKGFAEGGNLKNHIRFHMGERPYQCTVCEKSYRTHYSRSVHMRSHTNERPFVCDDCGKGFYSSGKLAIHRRIHTGEKPYGCGSCDARFMDRCGLRRHQTKAH